jgi:Predicted transmembrane sensor domain
VKQYRPHFFAVIALAIVLSCGWHGALRHALADLRFAWQTRQATGDIVVVAIDAPSIDKIGVWPWPRQLYGELIRQLQNADVQDIALDVDFSTPSDTASDNALPKRCKAPADRSYCRRSSSPAPTGPPFTSTARSSNSPIIPGRRSSMSR